MLVGAEAISIGYGGIKFLSEITEMSANTTARGVREIQNGDENVSRIRSSGAGRKKLTVKYPELEGWIEEIVDQT